MLRLSRRRKLLLAMILILLLGVHVTLFVAGGTWRTLALVLLGVDLFSAIFVVGAIRETRKLERSGE